MPSQTAPKGAIAGDPPDALYDTPAVEPAPDPTPEAVPSADALPDLAAIIRAAVHDATADLRASVQALEQRAPAPQFRKMEAPPQPTRPFSLTDMKLGEQRDGVRGRIPVDANGLRLSNDELRRNPPRFVQGQTVKINRASTRNGHENVEVTWIQGHDPKTGLPKAIRQETRSPTNWGEIIDRLGPIRCKGVLPNTLVCGEPVPIGDVCSLCGSGPTIRKYEHLTKYSGHKYKVLVPGMTGANRLGDGFAEAELSPA